MTDEELLRMIRKHDQDLYQGDSRKPALTIRIELTEKEIEDMKEAAQEMKNNSRQMKVMIIGIILTIIGDIIAKLVGH